MVEREKTEVESENVREGGDTHIHTNFLERCAAWKIFSPFLSCQDRLS